MNAKQLFENGQLDAAIAAATTDVKQQPTAAAPRVSLATLLCFQGDFERADKHVEALGRFDTQAAVGANRWRSLIRGATKRQDCFRAGRIPDFISPPGELDQTYLLMNVALREGNSAEAAELVQRIEATRPRLSGNCDGEAFTDFRDMNDTTASFFEILLVNGNYAWVGFDKLSRIEFRAPKRMLDMVWREVQFMLKNGQEVLAFAPAIYPATSTTSEEELRLGLSTDWISSGEGPTQGVGRRMYWAGDAEKDVFAIERIDFDEVSTAT